MAKNRQSAALLLNNEQKQVILSGLLGDGYIHITNSNSAYFITNCKFQEYLDYKKGLLKDLFKKIDYKVENGFRKTPIYTLRSCSNDTLKIYKKYSLSQILDELDELGIALWFYDDGSLHKSTLFYNLNTQSFTKEEQEKYLIPFFNKMGIYPKLQIERKKDGRIFWYLRIGKFSGADKITLLLEKYPISCYSYKRWSSETIQKWSKFQEKLKSTDIDFSHCNIQKKIALFKKWSI